MTRRMIDAPVDFMSFAPGMSLRKIAAEYGCSLTLAKRWCVDAGLPVAERVVEWVPPSDFAERAATMRTAEMAAFYEVNINTVRRVLRLRGLRARTARPPAAVKPPKSPRRKRVAQWGYPKPAPGPGIPGGLADRAARHLMRDYRPVCRAATVTGDRGDSGWCVGALRLDTPGLLELAARRGWAA